MIRINLLGGPKPKRGRRAAAAASTGGGGESSRLLVMLGLLAVVTVLGNGLWYWSLSREASQLAESNAEADREKQRLAEVKARYDEAERQRQFYQRRIEVINRLRSNQSGPVDLLAMLGDTVNATDAVWLNTMKEEGNVVNIEGVALSVSAVANLVANLQRTGHFVSVEMKESYQDEKVTEMQAFLFTLACEKRKS